MVFPTILIGRHISKNDAILEVSERMDAIDWLQPNAQNRANALNANLMVLKSLNPSAGRPGCEGTLLFIMAKLSTVVCVKDGSQSFDLGVEITQPHSSEDADSGSSSASTPSRGSLSASMSRPKTYAQLMSLLNLTMLVASATGVASVLALAPFLDDVIYEPLRTGEVPWPVAFELMILYLRMIEKSPEFGR